MAAMVTIGRIAAIIAVFVGACIGWTTLGVVTSVRTRDQSSKLDGDVQVLWGHEQTQRAPSFTFRWQTPRPVQREENTGKAVKIIRETVWDDHERKLLPSSTRIDTDVHLDPRLRGLMWFALYDATFDGTWTYAHEQPEKGTVDINFQFPVPDAGYDDFRFVVDGRDLARDLRPEGGDLRPEGGALHANVNVAPGQTVTVSVHYRTRGRDTWRYEPAQGVASLRDFQMTAHTDFGAIDFPPGSMSPTTRAAEGNGWKLQWSFRQIVTGQGMGLVMPHRIQPGELATSMIATAPVSLLLFFVLLFALAVLQRLDIHPINYFALAGAFFSFHLLFAYSVDHLHIGWAFTLASAASIVMVISYMRLVVSARFAFREIALAQLVYQVGFSLAHFWNGYTGLTIAVLATATLFVLMQLTGRVRWTGVLTSRRTPPASPAPLAPAASPLLTSQDTPSSSSEPRP